MAWIKSFQGSTTERESANHLEVVGLVKVFELTDGHPIVQIDTNGSADQGQSWKAKPDYSNGSGSRERTL